MAIAISILAGLLIVALFAIGRIEIPTARQLAEEDIQWMRSQGIIDDEQTYQELVEGGVDPWP
jgi:hypothetical protein